MVVRTQHMLAIGGIVLTFICAGGAPGHADGRANASGFKGGQTKRGLQAVLVPMKSEYAPKEPLQLLFYLRNALPAPPYRDIVVDGALALWSHVHVEIRDDQGRNVPHLDSGTCVVVAEPGRPERFAHIAPGHLYGRELTKKRGMWRVRMKQPGPYRVRVLFYSDSKGEEWGLKAWTGTLKSNWVEVTVVDE